MYVTNHPLLHLHRVPVVLLMTLALTLSCSKSTPKATGPAADYEAAKDMFKRFRIDRALEYTYGLANASPATKYTERARVLRAVILVGQLKSSAEAMEAYTKGAEQTKNAHFKAEYSRLRHDNMQDGMRAGLGLAETTHQLLDGGTISKELTLEASYPTTEGPIEVREFERIKEGGWVEPDQQDAAALDSLHKGIDDALADAVVGDRSKARNALASGSTEISGLDFALFLGKGLADGAVLFDRKHGRDGQRLKTVCGEADEAVKVAAALLKANPDKDKEKQLKKLQDQIKATLKNV